MILNDLLQKHQFSFYMATLKGRNNQGLFLFLLLDPWYIIYKIFILLFIDKQLIGTNFTYQHF